MRNRVPFLLLVLVCLSGCGQRWIMKSDANGSVWRNISAARARDWNNSQEKCAYPLRISRPRTDLGYPFYEQDSIRIYVDSSDLLLNRLVSEGFIQGCFLLSPFNPCGKIQAVYINPTKALLHGWRGYHFYLGSLAEVPIRMPSSNQRHISLYKDYRLSFSYAGQPFINPVVIRLRIMNGQYVFNRKNLSLDMFLSGAKTVLFYQSGVEI